MKTQILFLFLILPSIFLFAQDGQLDPSFDLDGKVITQISADPVSNYDDCYDIALQEDGKIVAVGQSQYSEYYLQWCIIRYNPDGSIDNSFGNSGIVRGDLGYEGNNYGISVAIINHKILLAGYGFNGVPYSDYVSFVARFNEDGSVDSTFGLNGMSPLVSSMRVTDMVLQPDGKIVLAGYRGSNGGYEDFSVMRFDSTGFLDVSFNWSGIVTTPFYISDTDLANTVAIDNNGKIIAGGQTDIFMVLVRYNTDGSLDSSFGIDGKVKSDSFGWGSSWGLAISLTQSNKILLAGRTQNSFFAVARFNYDGSLDSTFGVNGLAQASTSGLAYAISQQEDGKIVLAGLSPIGAGSNLVLVRFFPDGSIDASFGINGTVITNLSNYCYARSAAIQPDGSIIAAGSAKKNGSYAFALTRYLSSFDSSIAVGIIDDFEQPIQSQTIYPNPVKFSTTLKYTLKLQETVSISLYDLQGRLIKSFQQKEPEQPGKHTKLLDFAGSMPSGNYILTLSAGEKQVSININKQ